MKKSATSVNEPTCDWEMGPPPTTPIKTQPDQDLSGIVKDFYKKELSGAIICMPTTVGSSLGGASLMGVGSLGVGPKAMLFSHHIDSVSYAGLLMDDVWNDRRVITIDLLGDEFLEAVKSGDTVSIKEDGTVEVG